MKYIPLLFQPEMAAAAYAGNKTITRRLRGLKQINENPDDWTLGSFKEGIAVYKRKFFGEIVTVPIKCPYGQPGDVLWVRERFLQCIEYDYNDVPAIDEQGNPIDMVVHFASHPDFRYFDGTSDFPTEKIPWKPSIHMPKAACRMFLKVKSIRAERLHEITEDDAKAEGVKPSVSFTTPYYDGFLGLWISINGIASWMDNPWVWRVEFERIEKPQDFI